MEREQQSLQKNIHLMKKEIVMKNTVKKILALVFVVAMVCSLAVPAFAAFSSFSVTVYVVDETGAKVATQTVTVDKAEKANVLDALKKADTDNDNFKFTIKNNILTAVADKDDEYIESADVFETASWVVAVNGKPVNGDLAAASIAKNNTIVVYWSDATIGSKLIRFNDDAIAQGIVSFYYYDAEGVKQPLVGAAVEIQNVNNLLFKSTDIATGAGSEYVEDYNTFVTDEKGQIWIAPDYLDGSADTTSGDDKDLYLISSVKVKPAASLLKVDGYTDEEIEFFDDYKEYELVKTLIDGKFITVDEDLYNVAGATGDMTVVYALVAFAAVATLAAVVVMKKKSVKAN
jgi:hypothetical protein